MSEDKTQIKMPGIQAVEAANRLETMGEAFRKAGVWGVDSVGESKDRSVEHVVRLGELARETGMSLEAAKQMHDRMALIHPAPRRPWRHRLDIEKIAVILIAIFVAAIAVNHFRLVNARIEAARPCADQRR